MIHRASAREFEYIDPFICRIDPITLTGLALAAVGGGVTSAIAGGSGAPAAPTPAPLASTPAPAQQPQTKTQPVSQQPTFLGAAATPPTQSGQKTLLGQ